MRALEMTRPSPRQCAPGAGPPSSGRRNVIRRCILDRHHLRTVTEPKPAPSLAPSEAPQPGGPDEPLVDLLRALQALQLGEGTAHGVVDDRPAPRLDADALQDLEGAAVRPPCLDLPHPRMDEQLGRYLVEGLGPEEGTLQGVPELLDALEDSAWSREAVSEDDTAVPNDLDAVGDPGGRGR